MTNESLPNLKPTGRTRVRRIAKHGVYDRRVIYDILDEALICHVGFVDGGHPFVLPTIHVRIEDRLYLHGAKGNRMLDGITSGTAACVTVTLVDGLVPARSAFHHSMNYRSVVILSRAAWRSPIREISQGFSTRWWNTRYLVDCATPGHRVRRNLTPLKSSRCQSTKHRRRSEPDRRSTTNPTTPCPSGPV